MVVTRKMRLSGLCAIAGLAASVSAQTVYEEIEPNDSKADAMINPVVVLEPGDSITGLSTSATGAGADLFLLQTAPQPLGIYRHRISITTTTTSGHTGTIRGLAQTSTGITADSNNSLQSSTAATTTPPRYNAWYGFGKEEQLYYSITGVSGSTAPYTATYDRTAVTFTDLGTVPGGLVVINSVDQGHTTDTEIWVYDENFNPVPGFNNNDEPAPGTTNRAKLQREFTSAGTFYIAITSQNMANNLPSPPDDRKAPMSVTDFPDIATCQQSTTNANISFTLTGGDGVNHPVAATRADPFQIVWFKFSVTAPAMGACCHPEGFCTTNSESFCEFEGNVYQGDGSTCGGVSCPQPPGGACCFFDGTCVHEDVYDCADGGGIWHGAGSQCADIVCLIRLQGALTGTNSQSASGAGIFLDLTAASNPVKIVKIDYLPNNVGAGNPVAVSIYRYPGSWVGHDDDPTGWELSESITTTSLGTGAISTPLMLTRPIQIGANETVGLYFVVTTGGFKYANVTAPGATYSDDNLTLFTNIVRGAPPWTGAPNSPRGFWGNLHYVLEDGTACYANCDESTIAPVLNVGDFTCFLQRFAAGEAYANCDESTIAPVLNVGDFTCFLQRFAAGCD